ncbi:MAG: DUF4276 family protein [Gammaproteobacteria bacterium]|nr:DUF4276 family protein [Gammaproteobacteria bacterium]
MQKDVIIVGEDKLCCALASKLIKEHNEKLRIYQEIVCNGFGDFKSRVSRMNQAAATVMPVIMLADADQRECVVEQLNDWLPKMPAKDFYLRLAVREVEAWLLADSEGFANFLAISPDLVAPQPEVLSDPKNHLLQLVRKSKNRELKDGMLPKKGISTPIGLEYNAILSRFVEQDWSACRAQLRAPSLSRAVNRLQGI